MKIYILALFVLISQFIFSQDQELEKEVALTMNDLTGLFGGTVNGDDIIWLTINRASEEEDAEYYYVLKTGKRELRGVASLSHEKIGDDKEYYLYLEGIEWEANKGMLLDPDGDEPESVPTFGIDFVVSLGDEAGDLLMQNYGNSMNYYMKIGEWDSKYVHLYRCIPSTIEDAD